MNTFGRQHYGEDFHWFLAKVVSDADTEFLGRVQIRVYGIHSQDQEKLPDSHLPWAQCLIPSTEGGISGIGQHSKILPGALVFGFFMDGKSCQIPFVLGSIHHKELPIPTRSDRNSLSDRFDEFDPRKQNFPEQPTGNDVDTLLDGDTNAEKIFNFFTNKGLTPAQASGIIGNFYAESSLNPGALNPNDKGKQSEGLAQWRGDRRERLISWSSERNVDYKSLTAQLNFTMFEFNTTEARAFGKLKNANTPREAAIAVCRFYERPEFKIVNGEYTSPSLNARIEAATDAYRRFARLGATA
jgi:hypothetical protein